MSNAIFVTVFFALLILVRGLIVVFHELGHAAAGLLLYKGNFTIYIGSYGDPTKGFHFKISRLKIHCIPNPLTWDHGLCWAESQTGSYKRNFLFTLGGPIGSLILGLLFLTALLSDMNEILKVYAFLAFIYAFADFVRNLIPRPVPIKLFGGGITYNDGYQLKMLLKNKTNFPCPSELAGLYTNNKYKEALEYYERMDQTQVNSFVLRIAAYMYLQEKRLEAAEKTFLQIKDEDLTPDDLSNFGLTYSYLEKHPEAFELYNKTLEKAENHLYALNNRGYSYNLIEEYEKALPDFDKAIELNPQFAYAYNNRGLSKIKLGRLEEGLDDIEKGLQIDASNSYGYRNKGIYHFDQKNYDEAYPLFLKAKDLDSETHLIDKYLEECRGLITIPV
jgi:Tfp pilus assembly protein PilF